MKNLFKKPTKLNALAGLLFGLVSFIMIAPISVAFAAFVGIGAALLPFMPLTAGILGTGAAGAGAEKTDDEKLLEKIKLEVKGLVDGEIVGTKNRMEHLEKLLKDLGEGVTVKQIKDEVVKLAETVKAMKETGSPSDLATDLRSQFKSWIEANKTALGNIKAGQKADLTPIVLKLNSPMTPANTYNSSAYLPQPEFAPGATDIVRLKPTFFDYIKKGRTSSAAYVWVNKKNPEGAAAFIGPGVAKPGVSFEIATEISNAKKVAASEKCATELLEDIDGLMSWFEQELVYQLRQKINTTLMTGTASSTVPAGIQTISVAYSLTTVKTTNPNHWDAIRACVAQLTSGNLYGPVTAFVNPIDKANMDLTKAQSQGQLYIPNDPGATIVEDNNIPVGYVQVALLDYYKVLIYKELAINFGWENDDFTKNLVTAICEMRIHQFFSENHTGAFIYDTFANIEAALTTV